MARRRPWSPVHTLPVPTVTRIDDADDPRLADFRDLTTADRRPDRPGGRGLVLAEGAVVVERLLASPYPVRAVLGVRRKLDELACVLAGVPAYEVTASLMASVVGFHLNRGVLASADKIAPPPVSSLLAGARLVAVLEGINDHENLGSIFRNAAALGVDAVLLGPRCADPLYRRSVRVSMGHVLRVPFAPLADWPASLPGFRTVALTPGVGAVPLPVAGLAALPRVALLLGAEGPGLSAEALATADLRVAIPMAPGVDSLNVATAAAIAFHAAGRVAPTSGDHGLVVEPDGVPSTTGP